MSSESSEQEQIASGVRGNLLYRGNRTHLPIRVGALPCSEAGESTAIIGIAELGGRFIVAVPGLVWNRKIAKRKIEKTALGKALSVDVVAAAPDDPHVATPEVNLRVWVGILAMGEEANVVFPGGDVTYDFGGGLLPYPDALVKVADDQFAFTTAESGGGGEGMFKRMAAVESGLSDMKGMLQQLLRSQGQTEDVGEPDLAPGARPKAGAVRAKVRKVRATNPTSGTGLNALDPGTVGAARQAGISEAALEEMARLIGNKKSKAEELPLPEPVERRVWRPRRCLGGRHQGSDAAGAHPTHEDSGEPLKAAGKAAPRPGLPSRPGADCEFEFGTFLGDDSAEQRGCFEDPHQSFRRDPQGDLSGHRDANAQGFRSGSCCFCLQGSVPQGRGCAPEAESGTTRTT